MQWLQDPNKSNVYNLNNVRRDGSRHFRSKMKKYLNLKTDDLETNSKIKNIRNEAVRQLMEQLGGLFCIILSLSVVSPWNH
jgi:hypothetical protein